MQSILFFGDSLTAGYGLANPSIESFPALIAERLKQDGFSYNVINAGLSGDTSAGGRSRLNYWLRQPIEIFVLELGINDLTRRIQPAVTYNNLNEILKTVRDKNPKAKLVLLGMQLPPFIPGAVVNEFRAIYKNLAEAWQMALVPFLLEGVAGVKGLNLRDGLHPSAAGYRILAGTVWPVLRKLL